MPRPILLACCALIPLACGEKKDPASSGDAAADAPAEESSAVSSAALPQDKTSQAFVKALVDLEITKFTPTDDGVLKYDTLSFSADATWTAGAAVEIMDERMECAEGGSWTMDAATTGTNAAMTWTVDATDCAGREPGDVQRALVELKDGRFAVSFR